MEEKVLREEIIALGMRLHELRVAVARGGNLSARLEENHILITATSSSLGELRDDEVIGVDLSDPASGDTRRLSTEFPLHRLIYRQFLPVTRIIHCHPPLINAYFSVYDDIEVLTFETKLFLGTVPVVKQSTPSISDPEEVTNALRLNNLVVVKNHGVVAVGQSFTDALYLIESLEDAVRMAGVARLFKKERLSPFEEELRRDLSTPELQTRHEMFSLSHIQAIVDLANNDEFIAQKGRELDLTVTLAVKHSEHPDKAYTFSFEQGRIVQVEQGDNAPFVISAPGEAWRQVFLGKLDPFVGTMQGKMKLKGELAKLTRWYLPFTRLFALFKAVPIQ
jgi:L-fuculose-phosphate aldolase